MNDELSKVRHELDVLKSELKVKIMSSETVI